MHNLRKKFFVVLLLTSIFIIYSKYYSTKKTFSTFLTGLGGTPMKKADFYGYVEGEFLYLALPTGGTLTHLFVQKGDTVKKGDTLFVLDPEPEALALREAEQRLKVAQAHLKDANKGQRPYEIEAIQARLHQIHVDLELAQIEQTRYETLLRQKMVQQEVLDAARATTKRHEARLEEAKAQLRTAQLSTREDLIDVAKAEVTIAQTNLEKAQWWLEKKKQSSPQAGQIIETFYHEGEWVPTGNPVLSLLPPEYLKVRFFIPERQLGRISLGENVCVTCDGCEQNILATVNYISPQAEYTPPVIYSQENRTKLVYMIEAKFVTLNKFLHPGQPVEVNEILSQDCVI